MVNRLCPRRLRSGDSRQRPRNADGNKRRSRHVHTVRPIGRARHHCDIGCIGAPQFAACAVNPRSASLPLNGLIPVTVTVTTSQTSAQVNDALHNGLRRLAMLVGLRFVPLFLGARKTAHAKRTLHAMVLLVMAGGY